MVFSRVDNIVIAYRWDGRGTWSTVPFRKEGRRRPRGKALSFPVSMASIFYELPSDGLVMVCFSKDGRNFNSG